MSPFQHAVLEIVRLVPAGSVVSYGQVAAYIGAPRAARQVGWAMRSLDSTPHFPWWRVLAGNGNITIKGSAHDAATLQKELLEAEGVSFINPHQLDISMYRFRPSAAQLAGLKLGSEHIQKLQTKYDIG